MLKGKSTLPGYRPLINIGCKYDYWKVIYFVSTEDIGRKKAYITYLYNFPYQFDNISISPVARPLLISELFEFVNEVESQKKYRQSDLLF